MQLKQSQQLPLATEAAPRAVFLVRELLRKMFFCVLDIPKEGEGEFCIECVADGDEAIDAYNSRRFNIELDSKFFLGLSPGVSQRRFLNLL